MKYRQTYQRPSVTAVCTCTHAQVIHTTSGKCIFKACSCKAYRRQKSADPSAAEKVKIDGVQFDSKFEAADARAWQRKLEAGEILSWRAHVPIDLIVNGYIVARLEIDFIIEHLDGTIEYFEAKGYQTEEWRLKWKIFLAMYSARPKTKVTLHQQRRWTPRFRPAA